MKKLFSLMILAFSTFFAVNALAFTPPPTPQKGWYVSDQAGKLTPDQINVLNQKIERISLATKNEFGILLLQDMSGDSIDDVANTTFKAWGVGKRGLDNGCLIVVSIKERKSRIETGKGIEGEVTDLQASDILKKNLNPHLKQGDFAGGFNDTLDALSSLMESRHNKKAEPPPVTPHASSSCDVSGTGDGSDMGTGIAAVIIILVVGLLGLRFWGRYRNRKAMERLNELNVELAEKHERDMEQARIDNELHAKQVEEESRRRAAEAARLRVVEETRRKTLPPPPLPKRVSSRPPPASPISAFPAPKKAPLVAAAAAATVVASAVALELESNKKEAIEREKRRQREREENEREDRAAELLRSISSSSSSSYSSSDSSSDDDDDSGSGFGGGDSGGGGSDSDW